MERAERSSVPLKSRCSRKWDAPAMASGSSREPTENHMPTLTERASGMRSVMTRTPEASSERSMPVSVTTDAEETGSAATAATSAATPAAAAATTATALAAAVVAGRTEIAELGGDLAVEGVLERDVLALGAVARRRGVVTGGSVVAGGSRRGRGRGRGRGGGRRGAGALGGVDRTGQRERHLAVGI